jgi:hypothetical protein
LRIETTQGGEHTVDQELISYLDKRFGESSQQYQDLREDLRAIASGLIIMDDKLQSSRKQTEQEFEDLRKLILDLSPAVVRVDLDGRDPLKIIKEQILGRPPE